MSFSYCILHILAQYLATVNNVYTLLHLIKAATSEVKCLTLKRYLLDHLLNASSLFLLIKLESEG